MIKIALFAAAQVVMYLLAAFVAWDLAWVVSLGDDEGFRRGAVVVLWCTVSVAAYSIISQTNMSLTD